MDFLVGTFSTVGKMGNLIVAITKYEMCPVQVDQIFGHFSLSSSGQMAENCQLSQLDFGLRLQYSMQPPGEICIS